MLSCYVIRNSENRYLGFDAMGVYWPDNLKFAHLFDQDDLAIFMRSPGYRAMISHVKTMGLEASVCSLSAEACSSEQLPQ